MRNHASKRLLSGAALALLCAHARAGEVRLQGRVHSADDTRPATLRVFCTAAPNGVSGVELIVADAASRADFDYTDFEGPDAPARARALTRVAIADDSGKTEIAHVATGGFTVQPANGFAFGVSQLFGTPGALPALLAAFDGSRGHVVWVQAAADGSGRELRGAFAYDATMAHSLQTAVADCLK